MLIDLHVYTAASGGRPLREAIAEAKRAGLDAICVVDRGASADTARAVLAGETDGFPVFVGVEIETRAGDVVAIVPNLDPFLSREEWKRLTALDRPTYTETQELVAAEGGVVVLSHPYDRSKTTAPRDKMFAMRGLSAVQIANDGAEFRGNKLAVEAVTAAGLPAVAGSARRGRSGGDANWYTLFARPVTSQAELVEAIKGGDFWPVEVGGRAEAPRREGPPSGPRPEGRRDDRRDDRRGPPGGGGGRDRDRGRDRGPRR
jgi:predicted metal-dependent phosphoesterase TrpH